MVESFSQHLWICLKKFLTDVTHGYFVPYVFQEEPLNHMESSKNKGLRFDALNQCSLLR